MKNLIKIIISAIIISFASAPLASADDNTPPVIAEWQTFWNTYDLDQMDNLFLKRDSLTYFSSEKEG